MSLDIVNEINHIKLINPAIQFLRWSQYASSHDLLHMHLHINNVNFMHSQDKSY